MRQGSGGVPRFLSRQSPVLGHELFLVFPPVGIELDALHRAYHFALWFSMMADAFGAAGGIDFIDLCAHVNGVVGALGLTDVAVDAFVGNQ